ncbi:hypothetical protein GCM10010330_55470 [Streptomyces tendae]|uniref:hypothetical protein n=1 Tax=Streptomyces tendae TaxID=1932 RepID=UPI001675E5B5|nr:hypothetical protein [Streptomyces tendae]GHA94280.1 hypothetical protein GCM10010330_55470 [Streptomyces tendae]
MALVPYEEVNQRSFEEESARRFTLVQVAKGTAELRGPCPRCGTAIQIPLVSGTYKSFRLWRRNGVRPTPPPGEVHEETVICTCEEDHPGRPEGKIGCGAYWCLEITTS